MMDCMLGDAVCDGDTMCSKSECSFIFVLIILFVESHPI